MTTCFFILKFMTNKKKSKPKTPLKLGYIANLNESVLTALKFFSKEKQVFPKNLFSSLPIIVGSGNAYNIAKALFNSQAAIFADESSFKKTIKACQSLILKKVIKEVLVISASGEKDSVWELKLAKEKKLKTILFTCNRESTAAKMADKVFVFKKLPEPYTYNVSTYLGMILAQEKGDAKKIKSFIENLSWPKSLANYKAYSFVLPDELEPLAPMIEIKRDELFGSHLSLRAFSEGQARHAKFVIPRKEELVISLGENKYFGLKNSRWEIKTKKKMNFSLALSICYYIIGKIQEQKPAYFKKNIKNYCQSGSLAYNKKEGFSVIVE